MSDARGPMDPGELWRSQRIEEYQVNVHRIVSRRARELYARTRAEIITSLAAPILFIAVVAWRFGFAKDRVVQWGLALILAWIRVSLYAMRRRIWGRHEPEPDAAPRRQWITTVMNCRNGGITSELVAVARADLSGVFRVPGGGAREGMACLSAHAERAAVRGFAADLVGVEPLAETAAGERAAAGT